MSCLPTEIIIIVYAVHQKVIRCGTLAIGGKARHSALAALLFHWGILQRVLAGFAWLLRRTLGVGGALALGAAVHVFVGMIEAPLLIRPYLARMQRGELFALMTCGMAGVAGTVMVIYASFLSPIVPNALGNILIESRPHLISPIGN